MSKTNAGYFFEDYRIGQRFAHATPRTVTSGERALYHALYPSRFALYCADSFAQSCGLPASPIEDLAAFHVIFGKTVPDISLNAVANLGYAEVRFLAPVMPGDTLAAESEVIGLKQTSSGKTGIVWVRTTGRRSDGTTVLSYCRWVMVRKRDVDAPAPETVVPQLAQAVSASDLVLPEGLNFTGYDRKAAGAPHLWDDYEIGEVIDHVDGSTVEEAEHMLATRMWQNTAKVHFNAAARPDGRRLIYGGHVISMARALSFNGLANAQMIAAINAGAHVNPCFAGDTVHAWSEVLDKAGTARDDIGALRLRLVAAKAPGTAGALRDADGAYGEDILLDLDLWALIPRNTA
ncbi:MaoC family dehydratase [Oceanibium sediminis]|uniref:MaoC family dehydratase n=1 Tax=Oceanibium sediminis TaxID=2026339 RepID=UPI000DD45370|nr:MaoC family dehydratase [Oceanibium sediminis]